MRIHLNDSNLLDSFIKRLVQQLFLLLCHFLRYLTQKSLSNQAALCWSVPDFHMSNRKMCECFALMSNLQSHGFFWEIHRTAVSDELTFKFVPQKDSITCPFQGFFICHIINYTGYNQKWNVGQIRSAQWTVQNI